MKNNRALSSQAVESILKAHNISKDAPPKSALFWRLWEQCYSIAEQALGTDFIQAIKLGTLDPVVYGGFNVSDAYYCFKGAEAYQFAASRAQDIVLEAFLTKKHESYDSYNQTFPKVWHVRDAAGIVPTKVTEQYAAFEAKVAQEADPIYCLIVMLPCEYLWAWLGAELSPAAPTNLYAPWIKGNNYPSGAYAMGNFLDAYQKQYPVDETLASEYYKQAMEFEYQNFAIATVKPK